MPKNFGLYQHYNDESIIVVARRNEAGEYECQRFFTYGRQDSFTLDADSFERGAAGSPIYVEKSVEE